MAIISGERLFITKMDSSMYEDVYRNSLDEDNKRFVPDEVFDSLEEAKEVVDSIIQSYESENGPYVYAIIRIEDSGISAMSNL